MRNFEIEFCVSDTYVNPLYPAPLEETELKVLAEGSFSSIEVRIEDSMGLWSNYPMTQKGKFYSALVQTLIKGEYQHFYFVIHSENEVWYYSQKGVSTCYPNKKDSFCLITGLTVPLWVASSTCYQIFPDRFCNGDTSNDVKNGEYSFDGGVVNTHSFDEIPEEFEKSRCLDFFNGDLKGIESKIDYLKELGITCLYLNPINASLTVHRYDSINFFQVDKKLGGDEALINLIKKCHENGIRVVVDISINHTGSNHPWFLRAKEEPNSEASLFYYKKGEDYRYWANVKTLPQLNYNCEKLRSIIYREKDSAMQKYLASPFNQDGWRLDVAPELGRTEKETLTKEVWREVHDSLKGVKEDLYLVGEDWNDAADYLQGDMWDGTMNYFGSGRILRRWMGEEDRFLVDGWGHAPKSTRPFTGDEMVDSFYNSQVSIPGQMNYFQMNLIDSHDTPRLQNDSAIYNEEIYKGVMLSLYMLPGLPNIYYGNEINLKGRMGSVEGSRYPMCWDESKWDVKLLEYFKKLGQLRKSYSKELSFGALKLFAFNDTAFGIYRYSEEKGVLAIVNRSSKFNNIELDSFLFSGLESFVIDGSVNVNESDCCDLTLPPFESVILLFR